MRIIGGKFRGRTLVPFKGRDIRPTSDRVKESLFNILAPEISGANVLDLFCGTGSVGLEAISRGADMVVFNDLSRDSLEVLKKNLGLLRASAKVYNLDFRALLQRLDVTFDIVFIDPPYRSGFAAEALELVAARGLLNTGGVAVVETDRPLEAAPASLVRYDERRYGGSQYGIQDIRPPGRIPWVGYAHTQGIHAAVHVEHAVMILHLKSIFSGSNARKGNLTAVSVIYPPFSGFPETVIIGVVVLAGGHVPQARTFFVFAIHALRASCVFSQVWARFAVIVFNHVTGLTSCSTGFTAH